jgi:hypothetical protein
MMMAPKASLLAIEIFMWILKDVMEKSVENFENIPGGRTVKQFLHITTENLRI